jgi:ribosomal-protein-alanine N-acetyltransferase
MFNKFFSLLNIRPSAGNVKEDTDSYPVQFRYMTKERKAKQLQEIFSNLPRFETRRLVLRRIEPGDCADMHEYSADSDVTEYLTWKPHADMKETRDYICDVQKRYANGRFFDWGLMYKADGRFVGTCGYTTINLNKNICEVGYVLSKRYWGMGLVPEALECIMDFAFSYFGFDKIEARFFEGNARSKKVMLKMGMTYEKTDKNLWHIKGEYKTVHTYSITKKTFESQKNDYNKIILINKLNSW